MATTSYAQWIVNECARAAQDGFRKLSSPDAFGVEHYLYYKTLSLVIASNKPSEEYKLARPERVPTDRTVEQLTRWIADCAYRLPILPTD